MGILEVLFIVLLVLKLTGIASISWLAVWSPIIIALVLYVIIFILVLAGGSKFKQKLPRRFK